VKKSILVICFVAGQLFWACSSGGDNPPEKTPEQLLADGWKAYSSRQYQLALTDFNSAAQGNPALADAFNGAGWANAKLNSLTASVVDFMDGLGKSPGNVQMKAGLSFVFNAQKLYDSSITRAGEALVADANWVFPRDTSVNQFDLHLLLAEDYFARTPPDYNASLAQVVGYLNPSFNAVVSTIAGQTALAAEIERLGTIY
jgi:hypothetical protein